MADSLNGLMQSIDRFARAREWDRFHSPKNLAMALMVEAAELAEHFQWLEGQESRNLSSQTREEVAMEMADVLIYLCRLASRLDIDPVRAAEEKMRRNEKRYPVELARGRADKYTTWQT